MTNTRKLVILSFLTALTIVLARFLSFQVQILRISLEFIPILIAAILFGPIAGGIVGAVADVIGFMMFPTGTFFPGFTISAFTTGIIYGLFFYKKQITWFRAITGTLVKLLIVDLLMVGTWLVILYKMPLAALIPTRLLKIAVMLVFETVFVYFGVRPILSRLSGLSMFKQSKAME
ncbi:MAG: folate family ECF transporter S component [Clostridia bacterium]|nr:folate family ECF transporter S component [Clostridia bacterium]MBN2883434.1 folate family ECF transporter S component [Clostridia bacterium]